MVLTRHHIHALFSVANHIVRRSKLCGVEKPTDDSLQEEPLVDQKEMVPPLMF